MNTNNQQVKSSLLISFGVVLLLLPTITVASQSSSSVISNITTTGNGSTVEISNTTIINGERTTYTYATTTDSNISHQVEITDGIVTKESTSVIANENDFSSEVAETVVTSRVPAATNTGTYTPPFRETSANIRWLENIIKYLHFYVEQLL